MESGSGVWQSLLYTWAPILLMLGFFLFFMRKMGSGKQARYIEHSMAFMDRQEKLLERIATALERRNARGE
jgi:ATP-dependent Zn protease